MSLDLPSRYDPNIIEPKWYGCWEEGGLFKPQEGSLKPGYTISIPPPNITGALHMGHSLCYPIQDALGRFHRLLGKNVWIIPGQDHAGIATQALIDKQLKKEGLSASKIGREAFVKRIWEWRDESGNTIIHQLKRLGCGFDWSSSRFTLDKEYAQAVLDVFIDWYDRGLIYKGKRVVNWDPVLQTSVSDIETERKVVKGKLYHIRYPFIDGSGEIIIATTRPETLLGDVAVAVHPSDTRYEDKIGKKLKVPLVDREIPLIEDLYPDPEFGTGALKITPAHDANDFEVGQRHQLTPIVVLDHKAKVNELGGIYQGLDRYAAREKIVADLKAEGYLIKIEDHEIAQVISERSGEVIEPLLSEQWFVKQSELASSVIDALKKDKIRFTPNRYGPLFLEWLENVHDWCISRQLWWGHRIPMYYTDSGKVVAAKSIEEAEQKIGEPVVKQEEDVLDTWFSSGLWPFAVLGWPCTKEKLKNHYPNSVLVTDRSIINLWVARMAMMGIDLIKEVPFHDVFIYATVLTENGKRMSKSLGTGVDPMEIIPKIGADALRWTLLSQTAENQEIRYSERRTEESRNFCTKIWNAARFILTNLEKKTYPTPTKLEVIDEWIIYQLQQTEKKVKEAYLNYHFQNAAHTLYTFFWTQLCDRYIEVCKSRLNNPNEKKTILWTLQTCLKGFITLAHPIIPHLTEEIFSYLPGSEGFLMSSSWPDLGSIKTNETTVQKVEKWFSMVRSIRSLRTELNLTAGQRFPILYFEGDLQEGEHLIASQAWFERLVHGKPAHEKCLTVYEEGCTFFIPVHGILDLDKELLRIEKESTKLKIEIEKISTRLNNKDFTSRAKPEVILTDQERLNELKSKLKKLLDHKELILN